MKSKKKPFLLVLDGPMGTGKTTVSKLLNEKLEGTARVGLDNVKRFISGFEKDHKYTKITQKVIHAMVNEYLKSGVSVITEWVMRKERVEHFIKIAKKNNVRFFTYELDAPKHLLIKRIKQRHFKQIRQKSEEFPKRTINETKKNFEKNYNFHIENRYDHTKTLDSEKLSADQIVKKILKDIK